MQCLVKDSMTQKVITIAWDADLTEAHRLMRKHKIRHLPVVGSHGDLVGVLSDSDLHRATSPDYSKDQIAPTELTRFAHGSKVRDYMNWPVLTIDSKQDLKTVLNLVLQKKLSSVVVTERGVLAGIMTTHDMLKVLLSLLGETKPARSMELDTFFDEGWTAVNV